MARIRTIKPEFWSHPVMARQDDAVKCLAIALLNLADDEGFFLADPPLVRSFARPLDEDSSITRQSLDQLRKIGWIEVNEHPTHGHIGMVANFSEHQSIDRPKPSKIKGYFSNNTRRSIGELSSLEQGTGNREQGTGNREQGKYYPPCQVWGDSCAAGSPPLASWHPCRTRSPKREALPRFCASSVPS